MVENRNYEEDWFSIPKKFKDISSTLDTEREFLEQISVFRNLEEKGWIADSGYRMPNVGKFVVGIIHGIEFVPDIADPTNGQIVVLKRFYRE